MKTKDIFNLEGRLGGDRARVVFDGSLAGEPVLWDATIYTRAGYARAHPEAALDRNLIEVGDPGPSGRRLTVVLALPCIDAPAVLKTLHMIRQWKRLAPGRHLFGGGER